VSFDLFRLLPAIYRIRDGEIAQSLVLLTPAEQSQLDVLKALTPPLPPDEQAQLAALTAKAARGPLESLLLVVQEQIAAVAYDLDQLYDDQFIETCSDWVIPYIGDLIGYKAVHGIAPSIDNPRAEVAETISLRRRKGTVLVLEQLARDATGWGAHAVELFKVLADTQYMNHLRPDNHYAPDLRRWQAGLYMNSGFDRTAHKVDVRRIASGRGRYDIQNIGIFLWSLGAYGVTAAPATPSAQNGTVCYRFDALGMDIPLFHRAKSQGEHIAAPAQPVNVPDRLRRRVLCDDLRKGIGAAYYGRGARLAIEIGGTLLNPYQIKVADLAGAEGAWANVPTPESPYVAVVDPELGRIAVRPPHAGSPPLPAPKLSYFYGFTGDLGGGEYARADGFTVGDSARTVPFPDPRFTDLAQAIGFAVAALSLNGKMAVEVSGSQTHTMAGPIHIDLPADSTLEIRAAQGSRPTVLLATELVVSGDVSSTLILDGLRIGAGAPFETATPAPAALLHVPALRPKTNTTNRLGLLRITHSTLVPGWSVDPHGHPRHADSPAVRVDQEGALVQATRSILGSVRAVELVTPSLTDCILDATSITGVAYSAPDNKSGGGPLTLEACTVIGKVHATVLTLVSNSILWGAIAPTDTAPWTSALIADRRQEGCVRFSFLPYQSVTPRQFKCVSRALASPQPYFGSLRYGRPAYAKVLAATDDSIRKGAEDGGEMGAFHFVYAPLREIDLETRLQEYMPVGLEFGLIHQLTRNDRPE
jgi:hypothetical protein